MMSLAEVDFSKGMWRGKIIGFRLVCPALFYNFAEWVKNAR